MNHPQIPVARDLMTRDLVTLRPDQPLMEAAGILAKKGISGAPVVDGSGRLLGVLSEYDCLRAAAGSQYTEAGHEGVSVEDLMSRDVYTIGPTMDLYGIAHELVTRRVRRLPVLDGDKLVGQISRQDVFRAVVALDAKLFKGKSYPDYPAGRSPIGDYPKK